MKHDVYDGEGMGIDENMTHFVASVLNGMKKRHVDVLWVMPGTKFSQEITTQALDKLKPFCDIYYPPPQRMNKKPSFIRFERQDLGTRYLSFPAHREWKTPDAFDKGAWFLPDPDTLQKTVETLEEEYKVPCLWSPSHMGMEVLRNIHNELKWPIEPLPSEQRQDFILLARQMSNWISWSKWTGKKPGLSEAQKGKRLVVGFDKNAQYLGSAQSAWLGNGGFIEVEADEDLPPFMFTDRVSFWQYELEDVSESAFNGVDLPCPLDRRGGWASASLIHACLKMGIKLAIKRGILWEHGEKYLARWAKEMWQHRVNLGECRDVALRRNCSGTAKLVPNSMVGRFAKEHSKEYFHPDWNRAIVHQAVTSQMFTLNKLYRDFGTQVVLVSKDAFYVVTDEVNPHEVIPGFTRYQHEQRGFKPIGVCKLTEELVAQFEVGQVTDIERAIKEEMKYAVITTMG